MNRESVNQSDDAITATEKTLVESLEEWLVVENPPADVSMERLRYENSSVPRYDSIL